jgi:hypothetical protein
MNLISLAECKKKLAESGWIFSHRSIIRTYVFTNEIHSWKTTAFTLRELRHAARYGF